VSSVVLLLLQAAVSVAPTPDAPDERLLHPVQPSPTCHPSPNEIVVCGHDADAYRLPKAGPLPDNPVLPKAEWKLFGDTTMGANAAQRVMPNTGRRGVAAMVTVKVPF
jgi:hypothetical protein